MDDFTRSQVTIQIQYMENMIMIGGGSHEFTIEYFSIFVTMINKKNINLR
ncbi:hypothetical protein J2Z66_007863 [Paenibacillus eucommiae]|uniref:Uncharacterized protein n=1 Tax=Paenibacillus eucommiae TaxID=1355755 RepID=A0ABS4J8P4_9BACL|nr:hypothetical protein [Paenibacillus eucommiae]